jgi:hypothetical protein
MAVAISLAGCVDTLGDVDASAPAQGQARLSIPAGATPRAATVALASVEGAPQPILDNFSRLTLAEAGSHDIAFTPPAKAHYQVRGYLSAYPVAEGTALSYVWDVFDAGKHRIQRVEDAITLRGSAADPWSLVDDRALASVAAKSADDLAAILANTPEAIAAVGAPDAIASATNAPAPAPAAKPAGLSAYR